MPLVFINYRRGDAQRYAALLYEWISERYGEDDVFWDVYSIEPGVDYTPSIEQAAASAQFMLIVIGTQWLVDAQGRRRFDDPQDHVRIEIEAALSRDIRIIPVLVGGATMPRADELPGSLAALARRHAFEIRDERALDKRALLDMLDRARDTGRERPIRGEPPPVPEAPRAGVPSLRARGGLIRLPSLLLVRLLTMRVRRREVPQRVSEREAARSEPVRGGPDIGAHAGERGDIVDCSVFSRPSAAAGETVFVQVFAHLVEQAEEVGAIAEEFDDDAERRAVKTLETVVPRESRLTFELRIPRLSVLEPVQSLVWRGTTESVQFEVEVPEETRPGDVVGTVTVALDSVPIGHVKFKLTVVTGDAKPGVHSEPVGDDAKRYTSVFVSYSAKDRRRVLEAVQALKAAGIHYFQDLLELDAGDRWERELYLRIDECDLFLLFWSSDAKASSWVRKEAQYAVDRKAGDDFAAPEIRPVIIEGPPIPPPWPELAHLHFSDSLVYLLAGLED